MSFIQQAFLGKTAWYTYAVTLILVFLGWQVLGVLPLVSVAAYCSESIEEFTQAGAANFMSLGVNNNLYLFLMIVSFAIGLFTLLWSVKKIHQRSIISLVTSRAKIDKRRILYAFLAWGVVSVLVVSVSIAAAPAAYVWNFKAIPFFTLLFISLVFLPLQTSFEELLFRGYFMQSLGCLVRNKWFPLLCTSVVFGLLHWLNPEVQKLGAISMVFYIGTGLFYGIVVLMDEGTELALGLHAANNIVAAFFVTTDWTVFQTDALFVSVSEPTVNWELFFPVFVLYPLLLLLFAKKYKWHSWKEKLTGAVVLPEEG